MKSQPPAKPQPLCRKVAQPSSTMFMAKTVCRWKGKKKSGMCSGIMPVSTFSTGSIAMPLHAVGGRKAW